MKLNGWQWLWLAAGVLAILWVIGDLANLWNSEPIMMLLVFSLLTVIGWKVMPSSELDQAFRGRNRRRR